MITALYIGVDKLDLYKDDNVIIKSSVSKIEDITKVFTDVSESFTVPASDINNAIFKHYYESDVLNGFDARKKVDGVIELDGINYKVGKFKLNKVSLKGNMPSDYNIDFFGNLVDLKDLLQDDKLTDLDLSALDFTLTGANVITKLTAEDDIIMSLFADKQYVYDSVNAITTTDKLVNIAYDGTGTTNGIDFKDVKGSVKSINIIEAIETKYGITFNREFFGLREFSNLYLLLSNKDESTKSKVNLTYTADPTTDLVSDIVLKTGLGTPTERDTSYVSFRVTATYGLPYEEMVYSMYIKQGSKIIARLENVLETNDLRITQSDFSEPFSDLTFLVESQEEIQFTTSINRKYGSTFVLSTGIPQTISLYFYPSNRLPNIKTIDYLKGLFQMFKLVAIPQKDGSIYINTLERYYKSGNVYDFSDYIDYKSTEISVGKILNEINYKFQEPQTILNKQFQELTGVAYGDLELTIEDDNGNKIDGSKLDYTVPFEQVVYEKINDISGGDTDILYALLADSEVSPVDIKPHLHYNYLSSLSDAIKIIDQNGNAQSVSNINSPIHTLGVVSPNYSTVFGEEFNEYNGTLISDTLYKNHQQSYIESVFSEKKRKYTVTAKDVPLQYILSLQLNDVIQIKDKYYRIDSYDINIITREIKFNLISAINLDLTPFTVVSLDSTTITLDSTVITLDQI